MKFPAPAINPGKPDELGAVYDGKGVNFALFSAHATKVELCLFDDDGKTELQRVELPKKSGDIWHGYIPDLKPGQVYGYRVHGAYAPEEGHRFNPNKLVLDPYAREIVGKVQWRGALEDPDIDSAPYTVKARVTKSLIPKTKRTTAPHDSSVIYELHLKGYTKTDETVDAALRGTAAGFASDPVIDRLKDLGVTDIEIMPVAAKLDEERLAQDKLGNYWGYNTLGFFAVENSYLASGKREEFRDMVGKLDEAGIGVILDVVFNHTAEGNHMGPTLSFRGIDNASYYKLDPCDKSKYIDETGCGNTLDISHPMVRRMVLDNLRYWVQEFGVAGFRFDLAPVLGRDKTSFDKAAAFFKELAEDPILSKVKLIAEPWDIGPGGYQLGNFPAGWAEWNDKFRDDARQFWHGGPATRGALATRLLGSSPEFEKQGRTSRDSVNFVACHDGFTLHDLVSHSYKKNDANGENNRDGSNNNHSHNHGAEGETDDQRIIDLRERQKRNFLATLFLSQGTPMLLAGDEHGNSQKGNNNAYCQDNETGWLNWDKIRVEGKKLAAFVKKMISFRKDHPVLDQKHFLHDKKDIRWISPKGEDMTSSDWHDQSSHNLGMLLNGEKESLLAVFNGHAKRADFTLPAADASGWKRILDTSDPALADDPKAYSGGYLLPEKSVVVFERKL